tara:strand:- start:17617 stop:17946 length:330 start_codon:yes stop_codon:yes gene_type:complete
MLNVFKKAPTTSVARIDPLEIEIRVERGDRLLSSALGQGVEWPHRCKVGSCGTCKAILLSGDIKPQLNFGYVLTPEEIEEGYILACQSTLKSDIHVLIKPRSKKRKGKR